MRDFRTDLQDVRALGIVMIVAFHVWANKVSGGVDVLFVLSGYFAVRTILSANPDRFGPAQMLAFVGRFAARTFPAALVVIGGTLAVAAATLGPLDQARVVRHAAFSIVQLQNFNLSWEGTDYLAREAPPSLFQHYWALSLQFQFFVALPVGVATAAFVRHRLLRDRIPMRALLGAGFVAVGAASFAFAWTEAVAHPGARYFDLPARLWEFMTGSVLALAGPRPAAARIPARVLYWAGLAAILACPFALPRGTLFPLPGSLLPVAGAALIIRAGSSLDSPATGWRPFARLSQVLARHSYAMYLVHWPVLIFYMEWSYQTSMSLMAGAGVIAVSCVLAALLHTMVENAIVRGGEGKVALRRWAVVAACPLTALAWTAAAQEISLQKARANLPVPGPPTRITRPPTADPRLKLVALATRELLPEPYLTGCHQGISGAEVKVCSFGSDRPDGMRVALVGGSHSLQWLPALQVLAEQWNIGVVNVTKGACVLGGSEGGIDVDGSCETWNAALLATLLQHKVTLVVTTATRPHPDGGDHVPRGYLDAWATMHAAGIRVLAIRDNPWLAMDAPTCVTRHVSDPGRCSVARAGALSVPSPLDAISPPGVSFLDLSDYFCGPDHCPAIHDGILLYRDRHHLSVPFARSLAPALKPALLRSLCSPLAYRSAETGMCPMSSGIAGERQ